MMVRKFIGMYRMHRILLSPKHVLLHRRKWSINLPMHILYLSMETKISQIRVHKSPSSFCSLFCQAKYMRQICLCRCFSTRIGACLPKLSVNCYFSYWTKIIERQFNLFRLDVFRAWVNITLSHFFFGNYFMRMRAVWGIFEWFRLFRIYWNVCRDCN